MRLTTNKIPVTNELASASSIPMGIILCPLADPGEEEAPIPLVDFGQDGPVRCTRCMGYVNPYCQFIDGGRKFKCNLCNEENLGIAFNSC